MEFNPDHISSYINAYPSLWARSWIGRRWKRKMIAIKDFKMPENCLKCPMQFGGWCYVSPPEVDERVAPTVDEAWEQGKPDWCPMVDVPDMNVGKCSEFPNNSDSISRRVAIDALKAIKYGLWEIDIPSPGNCLEYIEHHKQIKDMMEITDGWIKKLMELPSVQPEIIHCKDCEYGDKDEIGRWFCSSLGCQVGDEDGSGFCADAERKTDG